MSDENEPEQEPESEEGQTFDAAYVSKLRSEAAERRVAARTAEEATAAATARLEAVQGRLLALEVEAATRGVLADPSDLLAYVSADELRDEEGNPDPAKITATATELVERKAHLAPRPVIAGDVDQGVREASAEPFNLAGALRAAAG